MSYVKDMQLLGDRARKHLNRNGFATWLAEVEPLVPSLLAEQQLSVLAPIFGGCAAFVLLVEDSQGVKRVAKIMPPQQAKLQALALQAFNGRHSPQLLIKREHMLVMQYLPNTEQPNYLGFSEAAQLIDALSTNFSADLMLPVEELIESWVQEQINDGRPDEIIEALKFARQLVPQLQGESRLLHGDLGFHNLLRDNQAELWTVDPFGVAGPSAWDVGCLAFLWPGDKNPAPQNVTDRINELCRLISSQPVDAQQAAGWACIRSACSSGFGWGRDETDFSQSSLAIHHHLAQQFS
jgi:streptomycin 6-kinase